MSCRMTEISRARSLDRARIRIINPLEPDILINLAVVSLGSLSRD